MERSAGILLPIAALPSRHGIGSLGKAAYEWIDYLVKAGQSWWQILPVGPTSYGDSPYQSFSTFAGNPYYIDLDMLIEDGLLSESELPDESGMDPRTVDYGRIYETRFTVLKLATDRLWERDPEKIETFRKENAGWIENYALFMAAKWHFGMRAWTEWPDQELRFREPETVSLYTTLLEEDIRFFIALQYLFFSQWQALRAYARKKGIGIIGDLPIYVAMDSADVWSESRFFHLDENLQPIDVAGCPPDAFTEDGQLWGNPLYDWEEMRRDGYGWWIRRVDGAGKLYDMIRIDHFRGFDSFWAVPAGDKTAAGGRWIQGPGIDLVKRLTAWFCDLRFIAEDLGYLTPDVKKLLKDSGLPGMKVLEFAFDSREPGDYLPHNYTPNSVCYTGTHDNTPLAAWFEEAAPEDVGMAETYLGLNEKEGYTWGVLRGGMSSVSELFVAQLQDYLGLGAEARTNRPGSLGCNWKWRLTDGLLTDELAERIERMTWRCGRLPKKAETAETSEESAETPKEEG